MDKQTKNIDLLKHIIKYCEETAETINKFGDSFDKFKEDKDYFKSISMSLLQIGELANHLSKKFTEKYSDISWAKIVGLRNIIVHGYGILETETIWEVSREYAPALQKRCQEILKEIEK